MDRYVWTGTKRLRCGYTTGSCAAIAAGAAALMLLDGKLRHRHAIVTPTGVRVEADVCDPLIGDGMASCAVRKDAGDDVDVTDGLLVCACVERAGEPGVRIEGGPGVGVVTMPGLDQPVGAAAINSTPRAMITRAVEEAFAQTGEETRAVVRISVPGGAEVARRTFNSRVGVEGGISILGTTGIVEPRSVAALLDSIDLEIRQHEALGHRDLVLAPGNFGHDFVASDARLRRLPQVLFSNYLGYALDFCARHGMRRVLVVGHAGKLVKVAAGVMQTHSRTADCRREVICAHAAMVGISAAVARELMGCATTDACLDVLDREGLLQTVMASVVDAIADQVSMRAAGAFETAVVMFSNQRGELGHSAGCEGFVDAMLADLLAKGPMGE